MHVKFQARPILLSLVIVLAAFTLMTRYFLEQIREEGLRHAHREQDQGIKTFWQLIRSKGGTFRVEGSTLYLGNMVLNNNFEMPDTISSIFGGTATIFLGDTRIATSVRNERGQRAVGTKLVGPAYQALFVRKVPYRGESIILGEPYFAAYDPIIDASGRMIGAIYVGVKESEYLRHYQLIRRNVIATSVFLCIIASIFAFALLTIGRKIDEALEQSEKKFHALFADSPEAIMLFSDVIIDCNAQALQLLGYERSELIGLTPAQFSPELQPDGQSSAVKSADHVQKALAGSTEYFPWLHRRKDGSVVETEVALKSIPLDGEMLLLGTVHDVTERRQLENRLWDIATVLSEPGGESFFRNLVLQLCRLTGSNIALIAEISGAVPQADTIAVARNDGIVPNFSYPLHGTLCGLAAEQGIYYCQEGISALYPDDRVVKDMEIEGYMGVPLYDSRGLLIGILAILGKERLPDRAKLEPLFRIIATGAEGELERRRTNEALIQSEAYTRLLLESVGEGIYGVNPDGNISFINPAAAAMLGYEVEELIGRPSHATLHHHRGDDSDYPIAECPIHQVRENGTPHRGRGELFWKKDGTGFSVQYYCTPLHGKNNVIGFVIVFSDISAELEAENLLRRSEERYRTVFETTGTAMVIIEEDTTISLVNEEFVRLSGFPRKEIEGRKSWTAFVTGDDRERMLGYHYRRRSGSGHAPSVYEFDFIDRNDEAHCILASVCLIPGTSQSVMSYLDITERKKTEQFLSQERWIMEQIAGASPLTATLDLICRTVEGQIPSSRCVILSLDPDKTLLRICSAPSLPEAFAREIDETRIGPNCGSCGASAYNRSPEIVADITTDPRCAQSAAVPLKYELRACWAIPIIASNNDLLGTFAIYFPTVREPQEAELQLAERITYLAGLAIERHNILDSLQANVYFLKTLIDTIPNPVLYKNAAGVYIGCNKAFAHALGHEEGYIIGRTVFELLEPDLAAWYTEKDRELLANPGVQTFEASLPFADGKNHDLIFSKATFGRQGRTPEGIVNVMVDVTEMKQATATLRVHQRRVQAILDNIPDLVWLKDAESRFVVTNEAFANICGSTPQKLVGKNDLDIWPRDLAEAYRTDDREVMTLCRKKQLEELVEDTSGERHWVETIKMPVIDEYGNIAGTTGISRDIDMRKRAEDALRESEKRLAKAQQIARLGNWDWDIRTNTLVWSDEVYRIFGLDPGKCSTSYEAFLNLIHPDDLEAVRNAVEFSLDNRVPFSIEHRIVLADGQIRSVHEQGSVECGTDGSPLRMQGTVQDISERKDAETAIRLSEERFRELFEQNEDAILLLSRNTFEIIDANPAAETLTERSSQELAEIGLWPLIAPEYYNTVLHALTFEDGGRSFHLGQVGASRPNGEQIAISLWGKVINLRNEEVIYCSIRNISERIRLEEEARATQARLIHANKMTSLGVLVSGIAHEINNPNTFIQGNAMLLEKIWHDILPILSAYHNEEGEFFLGGLPSSELVEIIPRLTTGLKEGSKRISAIVSNLKDFAREDTSKTHRPIDINRIILDAKTILSHQIHSLTDHFRLTLADDLPPANGKAQQIEQVLINLIMNALQALPDKRAGVTVATTWDRHAGAVTVMVQDEGAGMTREVMDRLTEPFFSTKLDRGGTGLGLSISASIIHEHNGTLHFESTPGRGTTVTVTLPMA
ncbi:MAG: PAS domain S-box protein [Geobacter sp.]|nr:PAS domain S-box protein [Geobacter sp.]